MHIHDSLYLFLNEGSTIRYDVFIYKLEEKKAGDRVEKRRVQAEIDIYSAVRGKYGQKEKIFKRKSYCN